MSSETVAAGRRTRTHLAGWGWLLMATVSRAYLVLLGSLAACALVPILAGLSGSVVQSGSMRPHISAGDVVLSQALPAGAPPPLGRVITFRAPAGSARSGLVLHRLVGANSNGTLVTRGDANAVPDSTPLDRHNIISVARLLVPWVGLPALWAATGRFLLLGIWVLISAGALWVTAADALLGQPPADPRRRPRSGQGGQHPGAATEAAQHRKPQWSVLHRLRVAAGPAAVGLVAALSATALTAAPLGEVAATLNATTSSPANTWATAGPATRLAFTTTPSESAGGIAFATQPVVAVQEAGGNTVTVSSAAVTLSITTPAGATLACTANPTNAHSGVATFAGCAINKAGTYTLTATSGTLTTAVSTSFTIATGSATRLAFTTSPAGSPGAIAFAAQPVVAVQDAGGNTVTTSTASVNLSITSPAGAALTCTANPTSAASGVATFAGCSIDKNGTYTLTAAATGLTNAVSTSFTITVGSATRLAFTTSPSGSTGGIAFAAQPVVAVQDAGGNTVTTSTAPVTLSITVAGGATLACTANPTSALSGVATFAGCAIDKAGTYTLTAAAGGLTNATSTSLTVSVGTATRLAFTTSPSNTAVSTAFGTQPKVAVQDAGGNTVTTSSASITLSITTPGGATLACTANPTNAHSGVATFAGCKVNTAGPFSLTAAATGLTSATSASFTIFGPATQLAFSTSPAGSTGGIALTTQPQVAVQDAGGNTTTSTASVTLSITTAGGATLACTANPKAAVLGVATFAGCKIDKAGTYTLTAAATGLTNGVSASFTITVGSASRLAFTTSPSGSTGAIALATQPVVAVQDAGGNNTGTGTNAVTLSITTPGGATLTCTANPTSALSGVATFAGCAIDKAGTYTLTAAATGLAGAVSASFTITVGSATRLAFTTNPSGSSSGIALATQPVVAVQDAGGNTVTTSTAPVTLSITVAGGATLTCTANPTSALSGVATFAGCSIDKAGTYTLTAAATGLAGAVSTSAVITAGSASKLAFTASPSNAVHGANFGTQPKVAIQDASGNTVTTSSASITLSITTPGGATLTCTANPKAAVSGVATFAGCKISTAGTYTLTAATAGLTNGVSASFTIS